MSGNNTTNNPLFAGCEAGDYRLLPEPPCVNTGMLQPWMPGADLDGRAVPDRFSGLPDMGGYELVRQGVMFKLKSVASHRKPIYSLTKSQSHKEDGIIYYGTE